MMAFGSHTPRQRVVWSLSVVFMIGLGMAGCHWFERDRQASPTTPAGRTEALANYGGTSVFEGQWCVTVSPGGVIVNFPQAGSYKLHYGVAGWAGDIVLRLSGPATFTVGLQPGHVMQDVRVQAVVLNPGVTGRDMGSGVLRIWGPGDSGRWSDVCTPDGSRSEVVLVENGQLRVVMMCPVACPLCECQCPPVVAAGPRDADGDGVPDATDNCPTVPNPHQEVTDAPGCRFIDNTDGTITDATTGKMWEQNANAGGRGDWANADAYCTSLGTGGYTDWRLPRPSELKDELYDSGIRCVTMGPFTNIQCSWYWGTDTDDPPNYTGLPPGVAWYVHFEGDFVIGVGKGFDGYVCCVRG